jgi:hypothetical protein
LLAGRGCRLTCWFLGPVGSSERSGDICCRPRPVTGIQRTLTLAPASVLGRHRREPRGRSVSSDTSGGNGGSGRGRRGTLQAELHGQQDLRALLFVQIVAAVVLQAAVAAAADAPHPAAILLPLLLRSCTGTGSPSPRNSRGRGSARVVPLIRRSSPSVADTHESVVRGGCGAHCSSHTRPAARPRRPVRRASSSGSSSSSGGGGGSGRHRATGATLRRTGGRAWCWCR